jgi:hypothetical protein
MAESTVTEQSLLAELRIAVRGLLDADEAFRHAPTLENTSRLARARRRAEELLASELSR